MPERPEDPELERSTTRWMRWGVGLTLVFALAFPFYRWYEPSSRAAAREQEQQSLAEHGRDLFQTNCASCHGPQGTGATAPALNSQQFLTSATNEQISQLIAVGVPGTDMSAYALDYGGPLTIEQIEAIVTYLRSLEEDAPDRPDWRDPQGGGG